MRTNREGNWFGFLVMIVGVVYLLADLAKTYSIGISGWTTFFLLTGLWFIQNNRRRKELQD
ncbi:hypothetical protein [uncultured Methanolobus sp.]|uniref:hypothetical protein n=1 Tax=uncultured Methanolobus sp. TaxID=218300 RepID=UPI0029C88CF0|nr:hypothetical protein [uncultured Methanolobus sp.]